MSKKMQFPDGKVGVVSDKVAEILAKRKGHKVIESKPEPPAPFDEKKEKK